MSLPLQAVDRLFQRLSATYGASWDRSLGQSPIGDVKSAWAHELAGFCNRLDCLAWALEHLPERCPNVIEFRNLARKAPEPETPRLPEPPADPVRLRAELAKLQPILQRQPEHQIDRLAWAKRIVAKKRSGLPVAGGTLAIAQSALSMNGVQA